METINNKGLVDTPFTYISVAEVVDRELKSPATLKDDSLIL